MNIVFLSLACTLAFATVPLLIYAPFSKVINKKQKTILILLNILFVICCGFAFYFVVLFFGVNIAFYKWALMLVGAASLVANICVIPHKIYEHIFAFGVSSAQILTLFSVVAYVQNIFIKSDIITLLTINALLFAASFVIIYPIFRIVIVRTITPFIDMSNKEYWKYTFLIPISIYFMGLFTVPSNSYVDSFRIVASRVVLYFVILFICKVIASDGKRIQEKKRNAAQFSMQKEHYYAMLSKVQESNKLKHDFKHHIVAISHFANSGNVKEIKKYCSELMENQFNEDNIPFTGNSAADGILYHYKTIAQSKNVKFKINGKFTTKAFSDVDLSTLFGNALDNAFTNTTKLKDNRYINVAIKEQGNILAITVQNSFDGLVLKENNSILSRKRNNEKGIGIASMKSICKKYKGTMEIRYNDKEFSIMFLFPIPSDINSIANK